jgi:hypothetical protein
MSHRDCKAKTYRCSGPLITGPAHPRAPCNPPSLQVFIFCFRDEREIGKLIAIGEEGDGALSEVRNSRAVMITKRVQDKLTGRDFENEADPLDIDDQVHSPPRDHVRRESRVMTRVLQVSRLIIEAISEANLSQVPLLSVFDLFFRPASHADARSATSDGVRFGDMHSA